jgi:hypothetical protein
MKAVSSTVGVKVPADATVTADVGIGPRSESGLVSMLAVSLPGVDRADAEARRCRASGLSVFQRDPQQPLDEDHRRLFRFKLSFRVGPKGPDPES